MARQPFLRHPAIIQALRASPKSEPFKLGTGVRMQRPDHIALIGACLTLWPDVDTEFAMLLATLTRANSSAMVSVYSVLRRATGKYDALEAAANTALDKSGVEIIKAILSVTQSLEVERNDFAHGHWGISDLIPDAILWIDGKFTIDYHIRHRQAALIDRVPFNSDLGENI